MKIFKAFIIFIFFLTFKAAAGEIAGSPIITDGDTIKIINKRIRLHRLMHPKVNNYVKKILKNIDAE